MNPVDNLLTLVSPTPVPAELIMQDCGWSRDTLYQVISDARKRGFDITTRRKHVFVRSGFQAVYAAAEAAYEAL